MKTKKTLAIIAVVILLASFLTVGLVGCQAKLTNEEAFAGLREALELSKTQKTYFVKENKYSVREANDTTEFRMNVHEDDPDTTLLDMKALYSMSYTKAVSMSLLEFDQKFYGPSLSTKIKPSKAKDEDYKQYLIHSTVKDTTYKAVSAEEYFALEDVAKYTISNVLKPIGELTIEEMIGFSASKMGVVTTCTFTAAKEGHLYNGKDVKVQFMYGKISLIEVKDKGAAATQVASKIDITYKGPKVSIPSWDSKDYKEA